MESTTTGTEVIKKVQDIAAMAGFRVHPHEQIQDMLICPFDMGGGRSQNVYIAPVGKLSDGHDVVAFMSPCQALKKGLLSGMNRKQAVDLLQRNARLACGAFSIENFGEIDVLMVRSTQIVDTMEVEEFRTHAGFVAIVADEYEKEQGTDLF